MIGLEGWDQSQNLYFTKVNMNTVFPDAEGGLDITILPKINLKITIFTKICVYFPSYHQIVFFPLQKRNL